MTSRSRPKAAVPGQHKRTLSRGGGGWAGIRMRQPRRAASIAAMSIFPISIMASNARMATAGPGSAIAAVRARGVICHDSPHLSLHQPHARSWPPFPTIAFHNRSVSAWLSVAIWNEKASLCLNAAPRSGRDKGCPSQ